MPDKKRVLHIVVGSMPAGGIETFLMNVFRSIDREKVQFEFLYTTMERSFYDDEIERLGGVIHRFPGIGIRHPLYTRKALTKFFNESAFDCVHLHQGLMHYTRHFKLAKKCGVPKRVVHAHSTRKKPHGVKGWYAFIAHQLNKRLCLSAATDCFACSGPAAEWFGFTEFCPDRWRLIKNGIDLERFQFSHDVRAEARAELGVADSTFLIGTVGRLTAQKNQAFLLDVVAALKKVRPNTKLLLVGTGELEGELRARAEVLGLGDDVIWLSNRADTERLYCAMDCFAFPSTNEGLGIVMIEAQANGLTCLGSTGVPREAFVCGCAHQLPLGDVGAWVDVLASVEVAHRADDVIGPLRDAGFSIADTAAELQRFYLGE